MRTISRQRFIQENLDFLQIVDSDDGEMQKVRFVVVDDDGHVYDGVVDEDGTFNDGFTDWENVEVCERFGRFSGDAMPIAHKYISRWYTETVYFNQVTGEFFLLRTYSSASSCVMSSLSPHDAVLWFVQLGNYDELSIPEAPFVGIVLPDELMRGVTTAASADHRSVGAWVLNRIKEALGAESSASQ
jgi:hypothetical protein